MDRINPPNSPLKTIDPRLLSLDQPIAHQLETAPATGTNKPISGSALGKHSLVNKHGYIAGTSTHASTLRPRQQPVCRIPISNSMIPTANTTLRKRKQAHIEDDCQTIGVPTKASSEQFNRECPLAKRSKPPPVTVPPQVSKRWKKPKSARTAQLPMSTLKPSPALAKVFKMLDEQMGISQQPAVTSLPAQSPAITITTPGSSTRGNDSHASASTGSTQPNNTSGHSNTQHAKTGPTGLKPDILSTMPSTSRKHEMLHEQAHTICLDGPAHPKQQNKRKQSEKPAAERVSKKPRTSSAGPTNSPTPSTVTSNTPAPTYLAPPPAKHRSTKAPKPAVRVPRDAHELPNHVDNPAEVAAATRALKRHQEPLQSNSADPRRYKRLHTLSPIETSVPSRSMATARKTATKRQLGSIPTAASVPPSKKSRVQQLGSRPTATTPTIIDLTIDTTIPSPRPLTHQASPPATNALSQQTPWSDFLSSHLSQEAMLQLSQEALSIPRY
ncbi:MAG: hypothetical protein Q9166_006915 [cf. Caloplaca sp. 2 TL-2023]